MTKTNPRMELPASGFTHRLRRIRAGFSLLEVLVVVAVILIIAAIAIPRFLQSKMAANEAAVVHALRVITTAQVTYDSTYNQGFAATLSALGPPPPGSQASALHADMVDEVLASGIRNGYNFVYVAVAGGGGNPAMYTVNANPISPGQTGQRYFYVDQTNVIRYALGGPANAGSTPVPQ